MNGTTFDTLAAAKALREAGFDQRQAEAAADVMRASRDGLATKADLDTGLAGVRADMRADLYRALWIQTGAIIGTIAAASGIIVAAMALLQAAP